MAVIGCDIPVRVSGAESLGAKTGIWVKTHFRQEGNFLVATTYLVADGSPAVFELRVDLRPLEKIAAAIHARLHEKMASANGTPAVGFSFAKAWKSVKKTAKKIGQTKLIKAVTSTVKSVVKNKVFQLAMPMAAVTAHTLSKAAGGKGVLTGPAGALVDMGTSAVMKVVPGGALANAAPKALAAFGAAQAAIKAASTGKQLVSTALQAKNILAKGNAIAKRAVTVNTAAAKAAAKNAPAVKKAVALKAQLASPAVKAKLAAAQRQAVSAQKALARVAYDSKNATGAKRVDALKSRAIVNLVAQNQAQLAAIAQRNAGGLPALLIDKKGKITRGKYTIQPMGSRGSSSDLLYLGPGKTERGSFAKVSGEYTIVGTSRPPPRPRDRARDTVMADWLLEQQAKGKLRPRVGGCYAVPNGGGGSLRVSGTAPGLIGCDCGSEF